jgi:hypothetical protein
VPVPAAPLQPAVPSQASIQPAAPLPVSQSAAVSQAPPAQLLPIPKMAPPSNIPVASEPYNASLVPLRASGNSNQFRGMQIGNPQDLQVANEGAQNQQSFCALCLRSFDVPNVLLGKYQEYTSFCSEECQIRYFNALGDSSTISKMLSKEAAKNCCMECSKPIANNAIVLPCSHKLCSRRCGKQLLDRFFSNFPVGFRDLNYVTCSQCLQPIS